MKKVRYMIAQAAIIEYSAALAEKAAGMCKTSAFGNCGNFSSKIKITTSRKVNKKN